MTMTEVLVEEYKSIPKKIHAVEYDGDINTARALIEHKWLDGCAVGFDKNGNHEVLRGLVGAAIVYPGDLIIHHEDDSVEVMDGDMFDQHYKETGKSESLEADTEHIPVGEGISAESEPLGVEAITTQDPTNPKPDDVKAMEQIPSGENPDAVNLEPDDQQDETQDVDDDEDEEDDVNEEDIEE